MSEHDEFMDLGLADSKNRPEETHPAVDVCAACGQAMLTTPDDPRQTLICDVCLGACR